MEGFAIEERRRKSLPPKCEALRVARNAPNVHGVADNALQTRSGCVILLFRLSYPMGEDLEGEELGRTIIESPWSIKGEDDEGYAVLTFPTRRVGAEIRRDDISWPQVSEENAMAPAS